MRTVKAGMALSVIVLAVIIAMTAAYAAAPRMSSCGGWYDQQQTEEISHVAVHAIRCYVGETIADVEANGIADYGGAAIVVPLEVLNGYPDRESKRLSHQWWTVKFRQHGPNTFATMTYRGEVVTCEFSYVKG